MRQAHSDVKRAMKREAYNHGTLHRGKVWVRLPRERGRTPPAEPLAPPARFTAAPRHAGSLRQRDGPAVRQVRGRGRAGGGGGRGMAGGGGPRPRASTPGLGGGQAASGRWGRRRAFSRPRGADGHGAVPWPGSGWASCGRGPGVVVEGRWPTPAPSCSAPLPGGFKPGAAVGGGITGVLSSGKGRWWCWITSVLSTGINKLRALGANKTEPCGVFFRYCWAHRGW